MHISKSKPQPTSGETERARLSLDLDPATKSSFEEIRVKARIPTLTDLIKKSVAFFGVVTAHQAKGGDVILRHKDGKEDRVLFL